MSQILGFPLMHYDIFPNGIWISGVDWLNLHNLNRLFFDGGHIINIEFTVAIFMNYILVYFPLKQILVAREEVHPEFSFLVF